MEILQGIQWTNKKRSGFLSQGLKKDYMNLCCVPINNMDSKFDINREKH